MNQENQKNFLIYRQHHTERKKKRRKIKAKDNFDFDDNFSDVEVY